MNDSEADTLGRPMLRLSVPQFMTLIQNAKADKPDVSYQDPAGQVFCRNLCWVGAGFFGLIGVIATGLHWADRIVAPAGLFTWVAVFTILSFVGAATIHNAIGQRRIQAAMDAVDPAGIGRLVAHIQAIEVDRDRLIQRLDRMEERRESARAGLQDRIDKLEARMPELLVEAAKQVMYEYRAEMDAAIKQARDEAYVDLMSALENASVANGHNVLPLRPQPRPGSAT